jgi:hypothetical protein
MKAWKRLGCVGAVAAGLLAPAGPATAYVVPASGPTATFSAKGSHGYLIGFYLSPGASWISVAKRGEGLAGSETYYLRRQPTPTAGPIEADFEHLGRIRVQFRPNGKERVRKHHGCSGGARLTRFGSFEGTIRFHGEAGYTELAAKRVAGSLTTSPRLVCHRHHHPAGVVHSPGHHHPAPKETLTIFEAASTNGLQFEALQSSREPKSSLFVATDTEFHEGTVILRRALTVGHLGSFAFTPDLNSATITPPAPFSGSATFQRLDDYATRWEGPLTVSFPGLPDAALSGRDFSWRLASASARQGRIAVSAGLRLPRPLAPSLAQGSGSHSQAFWDARLSWSR